MLERNREFGALVLGDTARADFVDVRILDTQARACAATTCPDTPFGSAMTAVGGGILVVDHFEARGGPLCGLHLVAAEADLSNGVIAGFASGICMQTPGYDVTRLQRNVRFVDNGINLDSTMLPVPEAATAADAL